VTVKTTDAVNIVYNLHRIKNKGILFSIVRALWFGIRIEYKKLKRRIFN